MTYNAGIPQSNENLSTSQGQMLINFTQLDTQFKQDHDGFNISGSNGSGDHTQVTFLQPKTAPGAIYPKATLFTKPFGTAAPAPGLNTELYLQENRQTSGLLTNLVPTIKSMAQFTVPSSPGACSLITTNTLSFNITSATSGTGIQVVFATPLDYATYYVFVTINRPGLVGLAYVITAQATTGFTINASFVGAETVGYMVI